MWSKNIFIWWTHKIILKNTIRVKWKVEIWNFSRNADWHRNFLRANAKDSVNVCIRCKSKNIDTRL
jgi:hypothetical protein